MYLCEEYLRRHGIDVQYVRHVERGALFFRTDYDYTWRILSICWKPPVVHPGTYTVKTLKPVHDGYRNNALFEPTSDDLVLHWEEYEDFILRWSASLDEERVALNIKSAHLAAWEMLLRCFDGLLIQHDCYERFKNITNSDINVDERFLALHDSLDFISRNMVSMYEVWNYEIISYLRDYCCWLSNMVVLNGRKNV